MYLDRSLFLSLIAGLFFLFGAQGAGAAKGVLENPGGGSVQSGVGLISGWVCDANQVEIEIDGDTPLQAAYPTSRADTEPVCGDTNNGYALLFNYNILGDGSHTVRVSADGQQFAQKDFRVQTLGAEFIEGANGNVTLPDFPSVGSQVTLSWQESKQGFEVTQASLADTGKPVNQRRAQKMLGPWAFSTFITQFVQFNSVEENPERPGGFIFLGRTLFDDLAIGFFDPEEKSFLSVVPSRQTSNQIVSLFNFEGPNRVSGQSFEGTIDPVRIIDGPFSMVGVRSNTLRSFFGSGTSFSSAQQEGKMIQQDTGGLSPAERKELVNSIKDLLLDARELKTP